MGHRIMGSCHASKETKDPTDPNSRVPGTNLLPSCSIRSSLDPNKPGSTAHPEKANEDLSTPHTEAITPSSKAVPPSSPAAETADLVRVKSLIEIILRTAEGDFDTTVDYRMISIRVSPQDNVQTAVRNALNINKEQRLMRIIFGGTDLEDGDSFELHGVQSGATLDVVYATKNPPSSQQPAQPWSQRTTPAYSTPASGRQLFSSSGSSRSSSSVSCGSRSNRNRESVGASCGRGSGARGGSRLPSSWGRSTRGGSGRSSLRSRRSGRR